MRTKIAFIICLCLSILILPSMAQDKKFYKTLEHNSLKFKIPAGFNQVPVIENNDVGYEFALRNKTRTFEIRYRIWSVDTSAPPPNEVRVNPNTIFSGMLEAMKLNISGGNEGNSGLYDSAAVRNEFNADAGGTAFVECNSTFGKGYAYCMITVIHRDNIADAYVFYLFNDKKEIEKTMSRKDVFYSLKFK